MQGTHLHLAKELCVPKVCELDLDRFQISMRAEQVFWLQVTVCNTLTCVSTHRWVGLAVK